MEALFLIVVVAGIAFAGMKSGSNKKTAAWQSAAQRLGLKVDPSTLVSDKTMSGVTRKGYSVKIRANSSPVLNTTDTSCRLNFKQSLGLDLRITKQGPLGYLTRSTGAVDITTGDKDFDDEVVVKGKDKELVKRFLTPQIRLRVARFFFLYPHSVINDVALECEIKNADRDPDIMVRAVQRMTGLADLLMRQIEEPEIVEPEPIKTDYYIHEETPDYSIVVPSVEPILLEDDSTSEIKDLPDEVVKTADIQDQDTPAQQVPHESVPATIDSPAEPEWEQIDTIEEPDPEKEFEHDVQIQSIADELFESGKTSSQAVELFEERYEGKHIRWSGKLTNVRTYMFDLNFGNDPGIRAEIELPDLRTESIGTRPLKAVVRFPPNMEEPLRALLDLSLEFSGNLLSCDIFMRTVFVTDGEIHDGGR